MYVCMYVLLCMHLYAYFSISSVCMMKAGRIMKYIVCMYVCMSTMSIATFSYGEDDACVSIYVFVFDA